MQKSLSKCNPTFACLLWYRSSLWPCGCWSYRSS